MSEIGWQDLGSAVYLVKGGESREFKYYYLDSVSGVRKPLNPLGHQERHLACPSIPDGVHEHLGAVVLPLPPGVGPAQDDGVGLHPTKTTSLNPGMGQFLNALVDK